jgi:hypothetical protein
MPRVDRKNPMSLEDEVRRKLGRARRIRDPNVRLPGRPTTTNQSVGDVIGTFQTYEETVLMLAREIDKLRASISGR